MEPPAPTLTPLGQRDRGGEGGAGGGMDGTYCPSTASPRSITPLPQPRPRPCDAWSGADIHDEQAVHVDPATRHHLRDPPPPANAGWFPPHRRPEPLRPLAQPPPATPPASSEAEIGVRAEEGGSACALPRRAGGKGSARRRRGTGGGDQGPGAHDSGHGGGHWPLAVEDFRGVILAPCRIGSGIWGVSSFPI